MEHLDRFSLCVPHDVLIEPLKKPRPEDQFFLKLMTVHRYFSHKKERVNFPEPIFAKKFRYPIIFYKEKKFPTAVKHNILTQRKAGNWL